MDGIVSVERWTTRGDQSKGTNIYERSFVNEKCVLINQDHMNREETYSQSCGFDARRHVIYERSFVNDVENIAASQAFQNNVV